MPGWAGLLFNDNKGGACRSSTIIGMCQSVIFQMGMLVARKNGAAVMDTIQIHSWSRTLIEADDEDDVGGDLVGNL